jgi:hypothetical protein
VWVYINAIVEYGLWTGTGYENAPYYDLAMADIINGQVNWR